MRRNSTLYIIFLFFVQISVGQSKVSKEISGEVFEQSTQVAGVNIVNNTTQVATVSDENGKFSMMVREGDVLVFSAVNLNPLKYRITAEDLGLTVLLFRMSAKQVELKEVIVNENANITAENLGIIPHGQKKYTPAERRLLSGSSFLGAINGTNKILKKNVEVEKKERHIEKISHMFEDVYFVDYLKIPLEYVHGFKFYVVENEYAIALLERKDKSRLAVHLSELALKYNDIISSENK